LSAGVLLWLASRKLELWPSELGVPRPDLLAAAVAIQLPYALVRALRLRYLLDPIVARASGDPKARFSGRVLVGSGLVGFFLVILLPLRLGELSRPLLLARGRQPGVGFPEGLAAVAVERIVDGLCVVALLFLGLALAQPIDPAQRADIEAIRSFGRAMALLFGLALVALVVAGRWPTRMVAPLRRLGRPGERAADLGERITKALHPLYRLSAGGFFLAWCLAYWALTVAQLWLVLQACGVSLPVADAAAIVAIVGLSIQLPAGPAQAGSFQVGAALALGLFSVPAAAGSSFAALMYLLSVGGAGLLALPGLALLVGARERT
jgi:hypothetical protein